MEKTDLNTSNDIFNYMFKTFKTNVKGLSSLTIFDQTIEVERVNFEEKLDFDTLYIIDSNQKKEFIDTCEKTGIYPKAVLYHTDPNYRLGLDELSYFDLKITKEDLSRFEDVLLRLAIQELDANLPLSESIASSTETSSAREAIGTFAKEETSVSILEIFSDFVKTLLKDAKSLIEAVVEAKPLEEILLFEPTRGISLSQSGDYYHPSIPRDEETTTPATPSILNEILKNRYLIVYLGENYQMEIKLFEQNKELTFAIYNLDMEQIEFLVEILYKDNSKEEIQTNKLTLKIDKFKNISKLKFFVNK